MKAFWGGMISLEGGMKTFNGGGMKTLKGVG